MREPDFRDFSRQFPDPPAQESKLRFVAVGRSVMQGSECVATARSHSFAKQIAKALNKLRLGESAEQKYRHAESSRMRSA